MGLLAAVLATVLVAAGYLYARSRFGWLLPVAALLTAGNCWLAALLLLPAHPLWFTALVTVFAGIPVVFVTTIGLDLRFGLFPLDTIYGLLAPVLLVPGFYVLNLGLLWVT